MVESELADVRRVSAQFHNVDAAMEAGYELGYVNDAGNRIITGCVAHPTAGAMGYHYFNKELIDDLVVDVSKPEGLVYAPASNGDLKLVAVEYVVPGANSISARDVRAANRAWTGDGDSRPGGLLVHPARLGLEHHIRHGSSPTGAPRSPVPDKSLVDGGMEGGPRGRPPSGVEGELLATYLVESYTPPSRTLEPATGGRALAPRPSSCAKVSTSSTVVRRT